MNGLANYLAVAIASTTPILVTAVGGALAERARATNIGMEGMMLVGAFVALAVAAAAGSAWVGLGAGILAGTLAGLLLAAAVFVFACDVIIAGIGINLLASGLTLLLLNVLFDEPGTYSPAGVELLPRVGLGPLADVPVLGRALDRQSVLVYVTVLVVVLGVLVMRHTRFGVWIRAVGENEEAAAAAGISVDRIRTATLALSGLTAGIGGSFLSISALGVFAADMTSGRGFIALAAIIFGAATVLGTTGAAVVFGVAVAASIEFQDTVIPVQFVLMAPYVATILGLALYGLRRLRVERWSTTAPAALPPILPRD